MANSRKDQTYNTPALATLFLFAAPGRVDAGQGGLAWAAQRCATSSATIYGWADRSDFASPFVSGPAARSTTVVTIDLVDAVPASVVTGVLRANGIVDTESYRKLGRNQLRIATFPAIDPVDVERLVAAIDHVVERI